MGKFIDLTGQRFGRWLVIKREGSNKYNNAIWLCRCDCGIERVCSGTDLRQGKSRSCGCLKGENKIKHNKRHSRLYGVWMNLKQRCTNPKRKEYDKYGGRGITVCDEWLNDFQAFYNWAMANGYDENAPYGKCTIDRIDNDKGYSPDNCRWVDMKAQSNNISSNRRITYNGETHTIAEWGNIVKINRKTIHDRLSCGWSVERALTLRPKGETNDNGNKIQ